MFKEILPNIETFVEESNSVESTPKKKTLPQYVNPYFDNPQIKVDFKTGAFSFLEEKNPTIQIGVTKDKLTTMISGDRTVTDTKDIPDTLRYQRSITRFQSALRKYMSESHAAEPEYIILKKIDHGYQIIINPIYKHSEINNIRHNTYFRNITINLLKKNAPVLFKQQNREKVDNSVEEKIRKNKTPTRIKNTLYNSVAALYTQLEK